MGNPEIQISNSSLKLLCHSQYLKGETEDKDSESLEDIFFFSLESWKRPTKLSL